MGDKEKRINIESVINLLDLANASSDTEKEPNSDKSRPQRNATNKDVKETIHKFTDFITSLTSVKDKEKDKPDDENT